MKTLVQKQDVPKDLFDEKNISEIIDLEDGATRYALCKNDERIEAHIFIVMQAYYLQWHAMERLKPLFEPDGEGKDRRWRRTSSRTGKHKWRESTSG